MTEKEFELNLTGAADKFGAEHRDAVCKIELCTISAHYTDAQVRAIQALEQITQMQFREYTWLMDGHSIYAAYCPDEDEDDGLMFSGTHSDDTDFPDMNGWPIEDVSRKVYDDGLLLVKPE